MAEPILNVDANMVLEGGAEVRNARFAVLSSAPGSPHEGQMYYDSTKKEVGYYNGTEWKYSATAGKAEAGKEGLIELKEDLGGTSSAPTVVGLHPSGDLSIGHKLTKVSAPTENEDATNKLYVDEKIQEKLNGLSWKRVVTWCTTEALPAYTQSGSGATGKLEANANGVLTVDGHKVALNDSVLVKNAVEEKHNGIYKCTQEGTAGAKYILTRREDATTGAQLEGAACQIDSGLIFSDVEFTLDHAGAITVDTSLQTWVEFQSGAAIKGDEVLTTREGVTIKAIAGNAEPSAPAENEVTVNTVAVARIVKAKLKGNASATEFSVTHNLKSLHPVVQIYNSSKQQVVAGIEATSESAVKIIFGSAPSKTTEYFITVMA
jgi:hypothetical protein